MGLGGLVLILFAFSFLRRRIRGTWVFGREEVVYTPPRGRVRRVRWNDLRCILWTRHVVRLDDGVTEIPFNSLSLGEKPFLQAIERIRGRAGESFDLEFRSVRALMVYCLVLYTVVTLAAGICLGGWKLLSTRERVLLIAVIVGALVLNSIKEIRAKQRSYELHPRWRERRNGAS